MGGFSNLYGLLCFKDLFCEEGVALATLQYESGGSVKERQPTISAEIEVRVRPSFHTTCHGEADPCSFRELN